MQIGNYDVTLKHGIRRLESPPIPEPENKEMEEKENYKTPADTSEKEFMKSMPSGRVSVPNDSNSLITAMKGTLTMVDADFEREIIPLVRKLYKVNPDVSMALQDTFKLANTGHTFIFPNNTEEEAYNMTQHIKEAHKKWTRYTAGIDGLVNKLFVQALVSGAISIEAVPSIKLDGVASIVFVKPEEIYFKRANDGNYKPFQINKTGYNEKTDPYIELNTNTYRYIAIFSDVDEPNGVPPFISALEPLLSQKDMKTNFKEIMALVGMLGFLEVKVEKPSREASESVQKYTNRLNLFLKETKAQVKAGLKDGVVVGYQEDHEFKMNSTSKDVGNIDKLWQLNQQAVANGLSTTGTLIGVNNSTSEGGTGVMLSKLISQLKNLQMLAAYMLEFIYELELRLAGFKCKGIKVKFNSTTISDELKLQQGLEYKIRNLVALYNQGIIGQYQFAIEMGYDSPDQDEPRETEPDSDLQDSANKKSRKDDKNKSDRGGRDKNKIQPKRADQDGRPRGR